MKTKPFVKFYHKRLVIIVHAHYDYEFDLERCNTAAQLADWIFQIGTKAWCTPEILKLLIDTIDDACMKVFKNTAQGVFCPFGISGRKANWRTGSVTTETQIKK
jgi:hypothetical protein